MLAHRRRLELFPRASPQALELHQPHHPLAAGRPRPAHAGLRARGGLPYRRWLTSWEARINTRNPLGPVGAWAESRPVPPRVEPALGETWRTRHIARDAEGGLLRLDEREPQRGPWRRRPRLFFRISRSVRRVRTSFRSRPQLLAFLRRQTRTALRPVGPARARPMFGGPTPSGSSSRATCATDLRSSRTNPTAARLELIRELSPRSTRLAYSCHRGHRIRLSECVHESGFKPNIPQPGHSGSGMMISIPPLRGASGVVVCNQSCSGDGPGNTASQEIRAM